MTKKFFHGLVLLFIALVLGFIAWVVCGKNLLSWILLALVGPTIHSGSVHWRELTNKTENFPKIRPLFVFLLFSCIGTAHAQEPHTQIGTAETPLILSGEQVGLGNPEWRTMPNPGAEKLWFYEEDEWGTYYDHLDGSVHKKRELYFRHVWPLFHIVDGIVSHNAIASGHAMELVPWNRWIGTPLGIPITLLESALFVPLANAHWRHRQQFLEKWYQDHPQ